MTAISPSARHLAPQFARLDSRAVIAVSGPDWRTFLQGLLTQDVLTLGDGGLRFGAFLTPQGRLLYDLFIFGKADGCLIEVAADHRAALSQKLRLHRLRAKVEIAESDAAVGVLWGDIAPGLAGWAADPRAPGLGWRAYGATAPAGVAETDEAAYDSHRLALGLPGPADWGSDRNYPIEANFDLLGGIDFKKGCFVGQETTSRMKRRGVVKSRMAPIVFEGEAPTSGLGLLSGGLRAGQITSAAPGRAMALLRLDRLGEGALTMEDGRPWGPDWPAWLEGAIPAAGS